MAKFLNYVYLVKVTEGEDEDYREYIKGAYSSFDSAKQKACELYAEMLASRKDDEYEDETWCSLSCYIHRIPMDE